jgi:hypothetical protein
MYMAQFMLLIRGDDNPDITPEQAKAVVQQYRAWAGKLRAENRMLGGDELATGGKTLVSSGGDVRLVDGPYAETKEFIGGYFLIEADDETHAVAIARECPGLRRDGAVEIRAIVDHSQG